MNKKILFVSEAPWFSTGYSVYTNQVLRRLVGHPNLEFAQLAVYAESSDKEIANFPWKIYANKPNNSHPDIQNYQTNATAQFGDFTFNEVLLDFMPDIVMDIRDWWMIEFEQRSPFRDFYNWAIMPTVDATPQDNQWISTYESADGVFAYSEFGKDTLMGQCDNINFIDVAPPAASEAFLPVQDKEQHKNNMGISGDSFILGTVMRNQKRKLYPDLFKSFREILDRCRDDNLFLYCHTFYPDIGWNIPQLLDEYGLSNRVLFTYKCKKCGKISTDFFQDALQYCKHCSNFSNALVGISNPITETELAQVYNTFDVYVQYANSEGFGMPQLEAAYCDLPVISTYYSAMESVIDNIGGFGVKPVAFSTECETGCKRAIPDNEQFIRLFLELHKKPTEELKEIGQRIGKRARSHYTWDKTAEKWLNYILSVEPKDQMQTWKSPPRIFEPQTSMPSDIQSVADQVTYLFNNVLHKPEWIGGFFWRRVLRDCTFGYRCENVDHNCYFNESHIQSYNNHKPFSINDAFKELHNFRLQLNKWEQARYERNKK